MEIPGPPAFNSSVSQQTWEEEHAERERQRMEVAMLYGGRKNGLSPLVEETNSSQQEPEPEEPEETATQHSRQMEEEQEKQVETEKDKSDKSTDSAAEKDFEDELHQLDMLVQQSRSSGSINKSVPFQPHEWKEPISQTPPPLIVPPSESSGDEEEEEVEEEQDRPSSTQDGQLPAISITHTGGDSQTHNSDPFAPLQSLSQTSAPLLSEVLSAHSSYSESLPSKTLVTDVSEMAPFPGPPTVSSSSSSREHTPQTYLHSSRTEGSETSRSSTPSRIKVIDMPTEVQEVGNGIKVRAVQRTRWTPETHDAHTRRGEGEQTSSRAGGHNVVISDPNRRWTYGGSVQKSAAKVRVQHMTSIAETVACSQGS